MRGQKHDTFSKEFREEAIRQAREERRPLTALAQDLGVKYSTLRLWVKQAEEVDGERAGRDGDLAAENRRLRSENRQLRLEREILKNVWSAPPLQGCTRSMMKTVCVNVSGLLVEPQLLAFDGIRAHRSS